MTLNEKQSHLVTTARIAGVWYLIMGISGIFGFMVFHAQIFIPDEPEKTLANLTDRESFSRIRLLFEFVLIISQALTAVWFYKLFKDINAWGAWTVGIWGMVNSVAIMISAISISSVIEIANSSILAYDDKLVLVQLLGHLIKNAWGVGNIFFGLWLIPMGYIVIRSKRMPLWLGRVLIIGGIGYLLHTFLNYIGFSYPFLETLVIPATVGEFWMIGYLLIYGIRPLNGQVDIGIQE